MTTAQEFYAWAKAEGIRHYPAMTTEQYHSFVLHVGLRAWQRQQTRIDELEARLKEAERDAGRYRFLRTNTSTHQGPMVASYKGGLVVFMGEEVADTAIDAAIDAMARTADQQSGEGST
jgi:hypothetical protein